MEQVKFLKATLSDAEDEYLGESLLRILLNHYPNSVQLQEIYKEMMPQFPDRDHDKNFQREIRGYLTRFAKKGN